MSDPRDTQFAGFAKSLFHELYETDGVYYEITNDFWKEEWQEIIARRAYDLACHVLEQVPLLIQNVPNTLTVEEVVRYVPDMTKWPEERKE